MNRQRKTSIETILVTGVAGFIGRHLAQCLLSLGVDIIGLDNLNDYYDPRLKEYRLGLIKKAVKESKGAWQFVYDDLADRALADLASRTSCGRARKLRYLITETARRISPISATSWRASVGS